MIFDHFLILSKLRAIFRREQINFSVNAFFPYLTNERFFWERHGKLQFVLIRSDNPLQKDWLSNFFEQSNKSRFWALVYFERRVFIEVIKQDFYHWKFVNYRSRRFNQICVVKLWATNIFSSSKFIYSWNLSSCLLQGAKWPLNSMSSKAKMGHFNASWPWKEIPKQR